MHAGSKSPNTTPKGEGSSSKPSKKSKNVDDEVAKQISVGFGIDKYWYDLTSRHSKNPKLGNTHD